MSTTSTNVWNIPMGTSTLLPTACTSQTGPANVDGRCIMGGHIVHNRNLGTASPDTSKECSALPVYVLNNVPYTRGTMAGHRYASLANAYAYTKLHSQWATNS